MDSKRQELIDSLQRAERLAGELSDQLAEDGTFRAIAAKTTKAVLRRIQLPHERIWEIFMSPNILALLRMALDAGWLDATARATGSGITAQTLADLTGADAAIAARTMRGLASVGVVEEVNVKTYAANEMTKLLADTAMRDGLVHFTDNNSRTVARMPWYFAENNYQTPADDANGPFAYAEGGAFWEVVAKEPRRQAAFDRFMMAGRAMKKDWFRIFPVEKLKVSSEEDLLLVDIGGGLGHDLVAFDSYRKTFNMSGRLILQDLPSVLEKVPHEWRDGFTLVPHDFFQPQPPTTSDSRVFYMRMVLHDWADAACIKLLSHIRDAMESGYSRLLINEIVLPDVECGFWEAAFDVSIMAMHSGKERTRREWYDLIGRVEGLRVEGIWDIDEGASFESVVEVGRVVV